MMMSANKKVTTLSAAGQEYIKQIYLGSAEKQTTMHTKELAERIGANPASVTDMIKKLAQKQLINYQKGHGFSLNEKGNLEALLVIRRHRLWELFLGEKLGINWKEIHDIANRLQNIDAELLISSLEAYLGFPVYDPHGEVIPDASGHLPYTDRVEIYDLKVNQGATISGFRDSGKAFLEYIEKLKLLIGNKVRIISLIEYDKSLEIEVNTSEIFIITKETAQKIYVNINK
jgi:DtxR family Mn-dependent transcriptional regulator